MNAPVGSGRRVLNCAPPAAMAADALGAAIAPTAATPATRRAVSPALRERREREKKCFTFMRLLFVSRAPIGHRAVLKRATPRKVTPPGVTQAKREGGRSRPLSLLLCRLGLADRESLRARVARLQEAVTAVAGLGLQPDGHAVGALAARELRQREYEPLASLAARRGHACQPVGHELATVVGLQPHPAAAQADGGGLRAVDLGGRATHRA